jgi:hypothetical protein
LARAAKKKIGTTEIIAAIVVVIFIFSLVGILGTGSVVPTGETQQETAQPEIAAEETGEQMVETVVEEPAVQAPAQPTGTKLTSAEMDFDVRAPSGSGY